MSLENEINDIRKINEFKGITFSGFKKTDVKKELLNTLNQCKLEPACYWSSELICSGHFSDLWDIILLIYSKNIHGANPKLCIYILMKIDSFKKIINQGFFELDLRNNNKIRVLFCEIVCLLCLSKKKHSFDEIKINKEDFDMMYIKNKLKAPNVEFCTNFFLEDDPKELFVAINEFTYNISPEGKNALQACYWLEWIMQFEMICKSKKQKCFCARRTYIPVESKHQMDIVWLIWDAIINQNEEDKLILKILNTLKSLYCFKYISNSTNFNKRKFFIYFAISLITDNISLNEEIIKDTDKTKILEITSKIDLIYKQIKKNEKSPNTEYLFKDIKKNNLEKTIEKLEKMNTFENIFIPRV